MMTSSYKRPTAPQCKQVEADRIAAVKQALSDVFEPCSVIAARAGLSVANTTPFCYNLAASRHAEMSMVLDARKVPVPRFRRRSI